MIERPCPLQRSEEVLSKCFVDIQTDMLRINATDLWKFRLRAMAKSHLV